MQQRTHSCRLSLLAFFVVGGILLARVDVRAGIRAAGNPEPLIV
ncbi:hypothetical protein [Arsenicicoccus dermatophilus]|nr:hypothetical protein [Arsenicicoccus dermatophilus]